MKALSILFSWLFFWKRPKPVTIKLGTIHNQTSNLLENADNIAYWFSENKDQCTQEIATQLENSLSRLQALQSAILIKIREDNEALQIKRFKEAHEKRQARIKEQSKND